MKFWKSVKVGEKYEVHEWGPGYNDPEKPYVLAICGGPVPAGDIVVAMNLRQDLDKAKHNLRSAAQTLKEWADGDKRDQSIKFYACEGFQLPCGNPKL